jgi:hypothetical protein
MFDLNRAVAEWRRQMAEVGIVAPEVLEELESHLRESMEQQVRAGHNPQQAFDAATQQIGQANVLHQEFAKVGGRSLEQWKNAALTLAGIPSYSMTTSMNTSSNLEPRWATYLRGAGFLVPALFLWALAAVFMVPKLQQICRDAGLPQSVDATFFNAMHSAIGITLLFREHGVLIVSASLLALILLECRSSKWPRYRRATIGVIAFLLNTIILFSFFMMFLTALLVAPALFHAK